MALVLTTFGHQLLTETRNHWHNLHIPPLSITHCKHLSIRLAEPPSKQVVEHNAQLIKSFASVAGWGVPCFECSEIVRTWYTVWSCLWSVSAKALVVDPLAPLHLSCPWSLTNPPCLTTIPHPSINIWHLCQTHMYTPSLVTENMLSKLLRPCYTELRSPTRLPERINLKTRHNSPSRWLTNDFVSKASNSSMCSPVPKKKNGLFAAATLHPTSQPKEHML